MRVSGGGVGWNPVSPAPVLTALGAVLLLPRAFSPQRWVGLSYRARCPPSRRSAVRMGIYAPRMDTVGLAAMKKVGLSSMSILWMAATNLREY